MKDEVTKRKESMNSMVPSRYWIGNEFPAVFSIRAWDKIFDSFFNGTDFGNDPFAIQRELLGNNTTVPYDVMKVTGADGKETGLEMQFAVAGYDKKDINVEYDTENGILTISASKSSKDESEDKSKYLYKGIKHSEWKVSYILSNNVDKDRLKSELKNGTLIVSIPYVSDGKGLESKIKRIDVQSADDVSVTKD